MRFPILTQFYRPLRCANFTRSLVLSQDTLQPMPSGPFGESSPTEWYPPGHGDVYYSLYASGLLENLINQVWRVLA